MNSEDTFGCSICSLLRAGGGNDASSAGYSTAFLPWDIGIATEKACSGLRIRFFGNPTAMGDASSEEAT
jgi:hypothetical protein